mgnify:CR=1 FL=1
MACSGARSDFRTNPEIPTRLMANLTLRAARLNFSERRCRAQDFFRLVRPPRIHQMRSAGHIGSLVRLPGEALPKPHNRAALIVGFAVGRVRI